MNKREVPRIQKKNSEKEKLSKIAKFTYAKLDIQPYLLDPNLPTKMKQLAFKWRTRMIQVGWNYGQKEQCPICRKSDDTQAHLLVCDKLHNNSDISTEVDTHAVGLYNLQQHMRRLQASIRKREVVLELRSKSDSGAPVVLQP